MRPLLVALAALVPAADEPASEKFPVAKQGDVLLLPVRWNGKEYPFALDTGSTRTVYDSSLPLGRPREAVTVQTPDGPSRLNLYDPPAARLGTIALPADAPVAAADFTTMRRYHGRAVYGLLGMDFLKRHVVRIDFDRGEVAFLKAAGPSAGRAVRVEYRDGVPRVRGRVADRAASFVLDTGLVGYGSGNLEEGLFARLKREGQLDVVGTSVSHTVAGTKTRPIGRAVSLGLGEFGLDGPVFGEADFNSLGLDFWSRFVVTLDLANDTVYLKKGERYDRPDRRDRSGLHLLREDGRAWVDSVDRGSVAAARGVRAGDVVAAVGGEKVERLSLFEVRQKLCEPGATVRLTLRRGGEEFEVALALGR